MLQLKSEAEKNDYRSRLCDGHSCNFHSVTVHGKYGLWVAAVGYSCVCVCVFRTPPPPIPPASKMYLRLLFNFYFILLYLPFFFFYLFLSVCLLFLTTIMNKGNRGVPASSLSLLTDLTLKLAVSTNSLPFLLFSEKELCALHCFKHGGLLS